MKSEFGHLFIQSGYDLSPYLSERLIVQSFNQVREGQLSARVTNPNSLIFLFKLKCRLMIERRKRANDSEILIVLRTDLRLSMPELDKGVAFDRRDCLRHLDLLVGYQMYSFDVRGNRLLGRATLPPPRWN